MAMGDKIYSTTVPPKVPWDTILTIDGDCESPLGRSDSRSEEPNEKTSKRCSKRYPSKQ